MTSSRGQLRRVVKDWNAITTSNVYFMQHYPGGGNSELSEGSKITRPPPTPIQ